MNRADFDQLVADTVKATADLLIAKGAEYAGDADRLANFKRNALKNGQTVLETWQTYWGKHIDGINTYMARVKDEAVYLSILDLVTDYGNDRADGKEPHPSQLSSEGWRLMRERLSPEKFQKAVNARIPEAMSIVEGKLSEPIEGRFHDNINYSFLVLGLIKELRETKV